MYREMFRMIYNRLSKKEVADFEWEKKYIWSMARLGKLNKLNCGEVNDYVRGSGDVVEGGILVPKEFEEFSKISGNVSVWYEDTVQLSNKKEGAFRLHIEDCHNIFSCVRVLYGVASGILFLEFVGVLNIFKCQAPAGFSASALVKLLKADEQILTKFILDNGVLNKAQKGYIQKKGLDGLKK